MIFVNTHKLQILSVSCYGICFFEPSDLELEICNVYFFLPLMNTNKCASPAILELFRCDFSANMTGCYSHLAPYEALQVPIRSLRIREAHEFGKNWMFEISVFSIKS